MRIIRRSQTLNSSVLISLVGVLIGISAAHSATYAKSRELKPRSATTIATSNPENTVLDNSAWVPSSSKPLNLEDLPRTDKLYERDICGDTFPGCLVLNIALTRSSINLGRHNEICSAPSSDSQTLCCVIAGQLLPACVDILDFGFCEHIYMIRSSKLSDMLLTYAYAETGCSEGGGCYVDLPSQCDTDGAVSCPDSDACCPENTTCDPGTNATDAVRCILDPAFVPSGVPGGITSTSIHNPKITQVNKITMTRAANASPEKITPLAIGMKSTSAAPSRTIETSTFSISLTITTSSLSATGTATVSTVTAPGAQPSQSQESSSKKSNMTIGAVAGIVIGSIVAILISVLIVILFRHYLRRNTLQTSPRQRSFYGCTHQDTWHNEMGIRPRSEIRYGTHCHPIELEAVPIAHCKSGRSTSNSSYHS